MRKLLAILLALMMVFSMSFAAFAEDAASDEDAATAEDAFVIPVPDKVVVSTQKLMVDGKIVDVQPYNIDGANYFKLRDMAALLNGTGSQFNVAYEAPNMIVTLGEGYEKIDGDLVKGDDKSGTCVPSKQVLMIDGEKVDILVYNIGNSNYFQLRGLGELVGFAVDYDGETKTMIVESEGYEPADDEEEADEEEADEEEGAK